jgi:hypothetical protein
MLDTNTCNKKKRQYNNITKKQSGTSSMLCDSIQRLNNGGTLAPTLAELQHINAVPACPLCADRKRIVSTAKYNLSPRDYRSVAKDSRNCVVQWSDCVLSQSLYVMKTLHLDAVAVCENCAPLRRRRAINGVHSLDVISAADLITGFKLRNCKNASYIDVWIGPSRVVHIPLSCHQEKEEEEEEEGSMDQHVRFYTEGVVRVAIHSCEKQEEEEEFCEIDGIPLTALRYLGIYATTDSASVDIFPEYMYLNAELRRKIALRPVYAALGPDVRLKIHGGVLEQIVGLGVGTGQDAIALLGSK